MTVLLPVAVGGDIGVYALLRAFHEEYGCRAVVLSAVATRAVRDSSFIDNVVVPGIDDAETLVQALEEIGTAHPGATKVLVTNADWYVEMLVANRARLEAHYLMPFCSPEALALVSDKDTFAQVCAELSIPTPQSVSVHIPDLAAAEVRSLPIDLAYPLVAKPASSADYHYVEFPGKKKIHHLADRGELDELLLALVHAGYRGTFLVQEFIPGDETQMRSLTAYRDSRGSVTLLATGRVLLEEHTPGTLGIPAAILTEPYEDAMDAASAFLNRVGYLGFANFDYKWDVRRHRHVFFEMNPRIGRNNYYVTAAGANPARFVVEDLVTGTAVAPVRVRAEILYCVVPFRWLLRYILDPALRARLKRVVRRGGLVHPLRYPAERSWRRRATVLAITVNYVRKYRHYYPRPTASGA